MPEKEIPWQKFRNKRVKVKFAHLNPALQVLIKKQPGIEDSNFVPIKSWRGTRLTTEVGAALFSANAIATQIRNKDLTSTAVSGSLAAGSLGLRNYAARIIQTAHEILAERMKTNGILQTKFEGNYPKDWINAGIVANTHPAFYVKRNGDVVFVPNSRAEYYRMKFQESRLGRLGLNAWRWRAYLKPLEAPAKVRVLVADRIKKLVQAHQAALKPIPAPAPSRILYFKRKLSRKPL